MWWIAAACAGGFFEPVAADGQVRMEVSGQTYLHDGFAISGGRFNISVTQDRWTAGFDLRLLDDPKASDQWDLRSANAYLGYNVVDTDRVKLMPFVLGGTHLQVGAAATVSFPTPIGALVLDASGGPITRLPSRSTLPQFPGIRPEPGRPEAGVGFDFAHSLHPSIRVGVVGVVDPQIALSARVGGRLYLRGALAREIDAPNGFGLLGVGVDL